MKVHRTRFGALMLTAALALSTIALSPASATPAPVGGHATGSIDVLGTPVPLPSSATFTGTHDPDSGALQVTLTADDLALSLPTPSGTIGITASFANPGGFTGTATGSTANLAGSVRLTLVDLDAPGVTLPVPIGFLNCSLTFPLDLTGTWDAATKVVEVTDRAVTVPALPTLCATGIQAVAGIDVNALLAQLPAGSISMHLAFSEPAAPTTTTTLAPPATTPTTVAVAPAAPAARPTSATPTYTG